MGDGKQINPSPEPARAQALAIRAKVLRAIREFFFRHDFMEVETPVRLRAPALETHIDAERSGDFFLRTSPELHMKRLLAEGFKKIWQMGPCFRQGERGRLHHPEYTMLEWYRADADYIDILADTKSLIAFVAHEVCGTTGLTYDGQKIELLPQWQVFTVSEAFIQFARWDPVKNWDEDRFNLDLVERVEPQLPRDVPVILKDYPAAAAALARRKSDNPAVAERWELYLGGIEIANAYSELTDVSEQRARFVESAKCREALGKEIYPFDEKFLCVLEIMPPSGGIALGIDRLVMLLANVYSIGVVQAFQE
jgi:lysyl-tRNA synthetase class 2